MALRWLSNSFLDLADASPALWPIMAAFRCGTCSNLKPFEALADLLTAEDTLDRLASCRGCGAACRGGALGGRIVGFEAAVC